MMLEYLLTTGIIIAFVGLVLGAILDRRNIAEILRKHRIGKFQISMAIAITVLFVVVALVLVKPTQQLFFDDAIYQGMALDLIHTGQAFMCDYGTPSACYIGEVFHEPIGTSLNFAIAFVVFGVRRIVAYGTMLFLAALAVFISFFAASLITKNNRIGYFTALFMALSPIMLVWAFPTTSDMPTLTYSLISLFFVLIFMNGKNIFSLSNALLSMALLAYMKVFAILYVLIFILIYLILDDRNFVHSLKNNYDMLKKHILDTRVLVVLLIFIIAIAPEVFYAAYEFQNGSYGATLIQNSCNPSAPPMNYTGTLTFDNFKYNFCANVLFWFDNYSYVYIMQPALFTIFAIIGVVSMLFGKQRKELAAIGIWFIVLFVIYTAFYAGGVIYGVDWRFMLSLVFQVSFFSGIGAWFIYENIGRSLKIKKLGRKPKAALAIVAIVLLLAAIFYPLFALAPKLSINPSSIMQAGNARFDENFIYTNISAIPSDCLVFTYVPYLFNINNRSAAQMFYLFNDTFMSSAESTYSCLVIDDGYWCNTPNNMCTSAMAEYKTSPLKTATYAKNGFTFGFYRIIGKNS
ncbi:MAG: hypothetical protein M1360_02570 [Candidatus Marsarchaeota archaeon]|jgi:hypothetical protein|nr:hypothetical protein [Candidatus Marsarchaeota archaeon]MCL5418801.1 hypothetical protein [Candidatus Marsarchaeota archaeon]